MKYYLGIHALFTAFEANFGMSLSIQELELSHNKVINLIIFYF